MRALVLVSGGIDSTVALWWALDQGYEVRALTFDYVKRPPPEKQATERIAEQADVELVEIDLPWLRELEDPVHPLLDNPELADAPDGYVPARNPILYAIAAHVAEIVGAEVVVGGHNGVDTERFPDASPSFFDRFGDLLSDSLATGMDLTFEQPLFGRDKVEVVEEGQRLGAPIEDSWSCYEEGPDPCGECPSCQARREAFEHAGVTGS
jgi:7-cyano-7-deazaguanine synthase